MAEDSKISWTDHTFNFWMGCSEVHEGCDHCYARYMMAERYRKVAWGDGGTRVMTVPSNWRKVFAWDRKAQAARKPAIVFCSSLSDVFEAWAGPMVNAKGEPLFYCESEFCARNGLGFDNFPLPPIGPEECCPLCRTGEPLTMHAARRLLFSHIIDVTPHLWWLVLTKRPGNIAALLPDAAEGSYEWWNGRAGGADRRYRGNVLFGTSPAADTDAQPLPQQLAAMRHLSRGTFWSCEPLLSSFTGSALPELLGVTYFGQGDGTGALWKQRQHDLDGPLVDWIIGGGETKAGSRPWPLEAARSLRNMTKAAHVPFHWKQNGDWLPLSEDFPGIAWNGARESVRHVMCDGRRYSGEHVQRPGDGHIYLNIGEKRSGRMLDGTLWDEFPQFLREFPAHAGQPVADC